LGNASAYSSSIKTPFNSILNLSIPNPICGAPSYYNLSFSQ
jgi:hypothetical protein